jgi:hypothetical protein
MASVNVGHCYLISELVGVRVKRVSTRPRQIHGVLITKDPSIVSSLPRRIIDVGRHEILFVTDLIDFPLKPRRPTHTM